MKVFLTTLFISLLGFQTAFAGLVDIDFSADSKLSGEVREMVRKVVTENCMNAEDGYISVVHESFKDGEYVRGFAERTYIVTLDVLYSNEGYDEINLKLNQELNFHGPIEDTLSLSYLDYTNEVCSK